MLKKLKNKLLLINTVSLAVLAVISFAAVFLTLRATVFFSADRALKQALEDYTPVRTALAYEIPKPEDFHVTVTLFEGEYPKGEVRYMTEKMPDGTVLIAECSIARENRMLKHLAITLAGSFTAFIALTYIISFYFANRAIEPVKQSYKAQKQFVSDASHELKTPLAAIKANLDVITPTPEQQRWFDSIRFETDRMIRLTKNLLTLSKYGQPPETSAVSLSDICRSAAVSVEASAFEQGITVNSEVQDNITVQGNLEQLEQLIAILLDNAVKYNKKGGFINITLSKKGRTAEFAVENTGEKLPDTTKIFNRFYRGDSSRSSDGFGLGLSIAHKIVSNHKGKIYVKSGETTVFSIILGLKNI